jgi:hypothetical protein
VREENSRGSVTGLSLIVEEVKEENQDDALAD